MFLCPNAILFVSPFVGWIGLHVANVLDIHIVSAQVTDNGNDVNVPENDVKRMRV